MKTPKIIAIDGPAASGKSTLAFKLADYMGYICLDTGVMYRAVAWAALHARIDPADEGGVSSLAEAMQIDVRPPSIQDGRIYDVIADGTDVTWLIRTPEVDAAVSAVSAYPRVRTAMTDQQRRLGRQGRVIMAGRDIGTVVFPDADLKIFLVASDRERAQRRCAEKIARGETASYDQILRAIQERDENDSHRALAPLKKAQDAIEIDSDGLTIDEVFERVKRLLV
jgi:cytidylate kinase